MKSVTTWLIIALGLATVALGLYIWGHRQADLARYWEQEASFEAAHRDTVWVPGEYHPDTTGYLARIDTLKGDIKRLNRLLRDAYGDTIWQLDSLPCPDPPGGHVDFDTTKVFGPGSNPLSVRVRGRFHWPQSLDSLNWVQILPAYPEKTPIQPQGGPIPPLRSVGLYVSCSSNGAWGYGAALKLKKGIATIAYHPRDQTYRLGISWDLIKF